MTEKYFEVISAQIENLAETGKRVEGHLKEIIGDMKEDIKDVKLDVKECKNKPCKVHTYQLVLLNLIVFGTVAFVLKGFFKAEYFPSNAVATTSIKQERFKIERTNQRHKTKSTVNTEGPGKEN